MINIHMHTAKHKGLVNFQTDQQITSIINCADLDEWEYNKTLVDDFHYLSGGIHPWDANKQPQLAEMATILTKVDIVGEIGLDTIWCEVPMVQQIRTFEIQLAYGVSFNKPIILHTKGAEELILQKIKQFPDHHFLIHWYSSDNLALAKAYLKLPNVYFSIGPDYFNNLAVQKLLKLVPLNRVFIESDGLDAICWALKQECIDYQTYQKHLNSMVAALAQHYKLTPASLERQFAKNLVNFMNCQKFVAG